MESLLNQLSLHVGYSTGETGTLLAQNRTKNCVVFTDTADRMRVRVSMQTEDGMAYALRLETLSPAVDCFDAECAFRLTLQNPPAEGYFANHLVGSYWCRPFIGTRISDCPPDTQALLLKRSDGTFCYLLAVCDADYKSSMSGAENGLEITVFSGYAQLNTCKTCVLILAEGKNPYALAESSTEYGLKQLRAGCIPKAQRVYPEILEYLGWCSWDAFQIRVSERAILQKCAELKEKHIPVRWALIDDMWADVPGLNEIPADAAFLDMLHAMQKCSLNSFEADAERFPEGLHHCIEQIKTRFGLQVGIWHPTTGYWHGILPDGTVAKTYAEDLATAANGQLIHGGAYEQAYSFYNAFHTFLKGCGADFIKVDNQGFLAKYYHGILPIGRVARNVHKAIDISADRSFGGALINCMGMPTESWWNRPNSAVARCSGDFMPESHEWFVKHLLQCAYNSFVQGTLMYCDWDMWWTDDGQALKNAVLHSVSGGPVYISDKLGRSKTGVVEPLVFCDGRILRCDRPAMPTVDCLTVDPLNSGAPFKLWTVANGCGVLCVMNLDAESKAVHGTVLPDDVFGDMAEEYLLYEFFSGKVQMIDRHTEIVLDLKDRDSLYLFLLIPMRSGVTPVGLTGKYIAPKSVIACKDRAFTLYEGGVCKFFTKKPVNNVTVNGKPVRFTQEGYLYTVDCTGVQRPTVEIN